MYLAYLYIVKNKSLAILLQRNTLILYYISIKGGFGMADQKKKVRLKDAVQKNQPSAYELGEELTDLTHDRLQKRTKSKPKKHNDS